MATEILPTLKKNALGHYVPVELIDPKALAEDELVNELHAQARYLQHVISTFKFNCLSAIAAHVNDSNADLGVVGDATAESDTFTNLASYDGQKKVKIAKGTRMSFGIEMKAAKLLIQSCVRKWSAGANPNLMAFVEHNFPSDREKDIDPGKLWELTSMHIEGDAEWNNAMAAIRKSVRYEFEKPYLRFYERDKDKKWDMLSLDMASLSRWEGDPPAPVALPGLPEPIKPIRTEADYQAAMVEIKRLLQADPALDSPEGERLDVLTTLAEAWETKQAPAPVAQ